MKENQLLSQLPEAFLNRMKKLLGEEYQAFAESYERERTQGLRVNGLKGEPNAFYQKNRDRFGLERIPWCLEGFYYEGQKRPGKNPLHEAGVYYIQEPSAMAAAELLNPKPGERVLDLCAAPGGKTTQIGVKLGKTGLLISNEIHPDRAKILSRNVERMGLVNTVVTNEEPKKLAAAFPEFFDKVLVDAPCSGEGMFRKEEQARIQWSQENVELCAARQREILDCAAETLRQGGQMVYSTCTFSPEENERQMEEFLERHPEFFLVQVKEGSRLSGLSLGRVEWSRRGQKDIEHTFRIWPHREKGEGHFIALLEKKAKEESAKYSQSRNGKKGEKTKGKKAEGWWKEKEEPVLLHEFFLDIFTDVFTDILQTKAEMKIEEAAEKGPGIQKLTLKELEENLIRMGDQVYRLPEGTPSLHGIKTLRAGLHLGTFKKKRFEPSHALALALHPDQVKRKILLSPEENQVWEYLAGQTLQTDLKEKGWVLVCIQEYSLGWGKAAEGVVKNHYPKGLRIVT